jgi:hypothetical protein
MRRVLLVALCMVTGMQISAAAQSATQSKAPTQPGAPAAQSKTSNTDLQILLDKLKADKKVVVAANMELTEAQKMVFWPIYDAYQKDLQVINERLVKAIRAYADAYNAKTITDDQANKLTDEVLAIEAEEIKLRASYAPKLRAVLPGKVVARYMQIEGKIRAAIRYDMASSIPLVP